MTGPELLRSLADLIDKKVGCMDTSSLFKTNDYIVGESCIGEMFSSIRRPKIECNITVQLQRTDEVMKLVTSYFE